VAPNLYHAEIGYQVAYFSETEGDCTIDLSFGYLHFGAGVGTRF
jgi:hypothetical protein